MFLFSGIYASIRIMNTKNIIVIIAALVLAAGIWFLNARMENPAPKAGDVNTVNAPPSPTEESLNEKSPATTTAPAIPKNGSLSLPSTRLLVEPLAFHRDINVGAMACGEKIGTFKITNPDSSKVLWWQITGSKPIWLNLSSTWGKTPDSVDMTYNCILSGAGNGPYDTSFDIVQTTEAGKMLSGYLFTVKVDGTMSGMAE